VGLDVVQGQEKRESVSVGYAGEGGGGEWRGSAGGMRAAWTWRVAGARTHTPAALAPRTCAGDFWARCPANHGGRRRTACGWSDPRTGTTQGKCTCNRQPRVGAGGNRDHHAGTGRSKQSPRTSRPPPRLRLWGDRQSAPGLRQRKQGAYVLQAVASSDRHGAAPGNQIHLLLLAEHV
jgi:hypothetical protein